MEPQDPIISSNRQPVEIPPSEATLRNPKFNSEAALKTALLLQAASRGYAERRNFASLGLARCLQQANKEVETLGQHLLAVSQRTEESWRRQIISSRVENQILDDMGRISMFMDVLRIDLGIKNYSSSEKNYSEVKELESSYRKRLSTYQEQLKNVCETIGFADLYQGLCLAIGEDWKTRFSTEALHLLSSYNLLFTPIGYQVCHAQPIPGELVADLTDTAGKKQLQGVIALEKKMPFLRDYRFFKPNSAIEHIHGAELNIPLKLPDGSYQVLVFSGYFKNDPINLTQQFEFIKTKHRLVLGEFNKQETIPEAFRVAYLKQYPLKDLLINSTEEVVADLQEDWKFVSKTPAKILPSFLLEFKNASFARQIKLFCLLTMQENIQPAVFLYQMVLKEFPLYLEALRNTMHCSLWRKLSVSLDELDEAKEKLKGLGEDKVGLESRIAMSKMDDNAKQKAMAKLKTIKQGSGESEKAEKYLNGLLKIPFGTYTSMPVNSGSAPEEIKAYLQKISQELDSAVHGHQQAKEAVLDWIAMRISNDAAKGECIGIEGPPGNGKTTLAKEGIAKALNRPFAFISLGGQTDSSYLCGHGYTYTASEWGRIIEILREKQCMDPVIYIDEVDKVSETEKGREIIGVLTALTDFSQNSEFQDRYFSGIPFDLSKALFIFSYNDRSKLDPIFRERLKIIKTDPLSIQDKLKIAKQHLLPDILKSCGFKEGEVTISDEEIKYLIENYTIEAGARKLKEHLFAIIRGLNRKRLIDPESVELPYTIDRQTIVNFRKEPQIEFNKIATKPMVGMCNGLYATEAGIGGILTIQVDRAPANEKLSLTLTGSLKKVIKESMVVARSVAWNLVTDEVREKIINSKPEGLHIHAPEGATPKDGPSAGGAITTAIISQLMDIPIRNDVAMTGEIDLIGRITKIGGLEAKLRGAKRAGAKVVLVPKDNEKDLAQIKEKFPELIEESFKVIFVENIHDILDHALVQNPLPRTPAFAACALHPPTETIE